MTPEENTAALGHRWDRLHKAAAPLECDCGAVWERGKLWQERCPRKGKPLFGSEDDMTDRDIAVALTGIDTDRLREAKIIAIAANRIMKLSARVGELETGDWRPIETAPKDGTELLGFEPSYFRGKGGVRVIMWMRGSRTPDGAWYDGAAWTCQPTLWQPLRRPPVKGA